MAFKLANRASEPHPNWQQRMRTASHYVTWFIGKRFPTVFPFVFVLGYPKSGTTWMCQVVADYLRLPFPQHSLLPVGCPSVVHGHERASSRYPYLVYSIRDGRDALVSMYYFVLRGLPDSEKVRTPRHLRRFFPPEISKAEVSKNFVPFVERQLRRPVDGVNWGDHVRSFLESRRTHSAMLRYEDLLTNGAEALASAMAELSGDPPDSRRAEMALEKFSFARLANRQMGDVEQNSFLRKGASGDWRNYFTKEAAEIFDHYCGDMLVAAGYERDRGWTRDIPRSLDSDQRPQGAEPS